MSQRLERLSDNLRAEISSILQRDMKDPRVRLATVSEVRVSRDLSHAQVLVSVLGSDEDREKCIETLVSARGFVRSRLAEKVRLRTVPELHFELDRGAEHSERINAILDGLTDRESTATYAANAGENADEKRHSPQTDREIGAKNDGAEADDPPTGDRPGDDD